MMALPPAPRKLLFGVALLASLAATAWLAIQDDEQTTGELIELATPSGPRNARPAKMARLPLLPTLTRPPAPEKNAQATDMFQSHAWTSPPPPKPAATAELPAKPVAPPLPYSYMGKLEDAPQGTLFLLSANNKVYTVLQGELIDRVWRVDGEDAASLHFTYVPLALPKTLAKSAAAVVPKQNNNQGIPG